MGRASLAEGLEFWLSKARRFSFLKVPISKKWARSCRPHKGCGEAKYLAGSLAMVGKPERLAVTIQTSYLVSNALAGSWERGKDTRNKTFCLGASTKPADAGRPAGDHRPALSHLVPVCYRMDAWVPFCPTLPYRSLSVSWAVKSHFSLPPTLSQLWGPETGPWHFCVHESHIPRVWADIALLCQSSELLLARVHLALCPQSRGCSCPTRCFPGPRQDPSGGTTSKQESRQPLPSSPRMGSWHCRTVTLFSCLLRPSHSGGALSPPPQAP